ncbi:helix-turn-helix domain-containing protein [Marinicella sediminis]|uniref:Helix-turn-helix domain-containing protein n=1 Tax=Marinicella sediminis TaxID=1792834 RepID=A0ABV7J8V2_9GAMM|nr:helix-turn-helix domain-containing protein [Marinicella sediminis]
MSITLPGLFYLMALAQAVLLVGVLWSKSRPGEPGRILALLVAVMAYKLLEGVLLNSDGYTALPHLIDWLPGVALLLGPIFLAYVNRMSGGERWTVRQWLLHGLPFLLVFFWGVPGLLLPAEQKVAMYTAWQNNATGGVIPGRFVVLLVVIKCHLGSYLWTAWRQLAEVAKQAVSQTSDDSRWTVQWQKKLCLMLMGLEAFWVVLFLAQQWFGLATLDAVGQYWLLFMSGLVLLMGYWGLQHPHLILVSPSSNDDPSPATTQSGESLPMDATDKYRHSLLDEETAELMAREIHRSLADEQLYLQPSLNLDQLSNHLGIRKHLVSQVINQTLQTSFFALINGYRVNHAKAMIDDRHHSFTLERIAIESGFNNRVTFNKAFKASEGHSPSVYRKELRLAS